MQFGKLFDRYSYSPKTGLEGLKGTFGKVYSFQCVESIAFLHENCECAMLKEILQVCNPRYCEIVPNAGVCRRGEAA